MAGKFDYFVVFAEMRTGSNFLEANLNRFADIECHGEAFNPHFIGYPNQTEIRDVTLAMRDADPERLINTIRDKSSGIGGFRFFHDHDARALELCLDDPRCAKVILTRNPLESYVSWKIAQVTGQWKLTNVKRRRDSKISFDIAEFEQYLGQLQAFQVHVMNCLQITGQTAFYVAYENLRDVDVINGLARYLGAEDQLDRLDASLKKQNPKPLESKVSNYQEMEEALAKTDFFNLSRTPNFEPHRGAAVPGYVTGATAPLLYMPVRSGPEDEVCSWLAALDGVTPGDLPRQFNQKALRQWKRRSGLHRSFTVIRHPVARAHAAFCEKVLKQDDEAFADIRKTLKNFHKLPIPGSWPDATYDRRAHRQAFAAFLEFLRANLSGQTGLRVDAHWATQTSLIQGMARFSAPDRVIREEEMESHLTALATQLGYEKPPRPARPAPDTPFPLSEIYDDEIESLTKAAYQRDYMMFGFEAWQ